MNTPEPNPGNNPPPPDQFSDPTVKVENGLCVISSIAAALQVKFGYSAATAISNAIAALEAEGVTTTPVNGGITVSGEDVMNVMISLGFSIKEINYNDPAQVLSHFNSGGFGIGHFNGTPGHDVFLTGYNSGSSAYLYYDSVTGSYSSGSPNAVLLYFN
ncbi:MAG: hypothetical protein LBV38_05145 [Alistipes sp.]|jgi:hypothetical protein|nr:hypothetical protein [Alistipes sp.]